MRATLWLTSRLCYRVKIINPEKRPSKGPFILVSNHVSFVDWMFISASLRKPVRFIMSYKYLKNPIIKLLLTEAKVIPISNSFDKPDVLLKSFKQIEKELQDNQILCMFPEGKFTTNGKLKNFKTGIEKISKNNQVDVIPVALKGMWGSYWSVKHGDTFFKKPKRIRAQVEVIYGDRVSYEIITAELLQEKVQALLG